MEPDDFIEERDDYPTYRDPDRVPEAELSIFGYGSLDGAMGEQIARLGLEGKVVLEGRTNDSPGALAGLDVFVLSSVNEGLPLVILEAMKTVFRLGAPADGTVAVVACHAGEQVEEGQLLVGFAGEEGSA